MEGRDAFWSRLGSFLTFLASFLRSLRRGGGWLTPSRFASPPQSVEVWHHQQPNKEWDKNYWRSKSNFKIGRRLNGRPFWWTAMLKMNFNIGFWILIFCKTGKKKVPFPIRNPMLKFTFSIAAHKNGLAFGLHPILKFIFFRRKLARKVRKDAKTTPKSITTLHRARTNRFSAVMQRHPAPADSSASCIFGVHFTMSSRMLAFNPSNVFILDLSSAPGLS